MVNADIQQIVTAYLYVIFFLNCINSINTITSWIFLMNYMNLHFVSISHNERHTLIEWSENGAVTANWKLKLNLLQFSFGCLCVALNFKVSHRFNKSIVNYYVPGKKTSAINYKAWLIVENNLSWYLFCVKYIAVVRRKWIELIIKCNFLRCCKIFVLLFYYRTARNRLPSGFV